MSNRWHLVPVILLKLQERAGPYAFVWLAASHRPVRMHVLLCFHRIHVKRRRSHEPPRAIGTRRIHTFEWRNRFPSKTIWFYSNCTWNSFDTLFVELTHLIWSVLCILRNSHFYPTCSVCPSRLNSISKIVWTWREWAFVCVPVARSYYIKPMIFSVMRICMRHGCYRRSIRAL